MNLRFPGTKIAALALVILASLGCSGKSLELNVPPANTDSPAPEGLAWWSRAAMDAYLRASVSLGQRSGYVALFAQDGHPVYANAAGWADVEAQRPMQMDTRMRFASMTKPVTAVAAMILVEAGKLGLDDDVAKYIPAYANPMIATSETKNADGGFDLRPATKPLTVHDLLMFASGIGPGMGIPGIADGTSDLQDYWEANSIYLPGPESLAERVDRIASLPLFEEPGSQWRYGFSADVLARVVEVAAQQPFGDFIQARILTPLGMDHTSYLPPEPERSELAVIYTQDENAELVVASPRMDLGWTPGGSGLVSTAEDYLRFALMLWNGGEYQGARILSASTVQEMSSLHLPGGVLEQEGIDGLGWGLGMAVVADGDNSLVPDNTGDYWWSGYFGTTFIVSPSTGLVGVVLSQNEPNQYSGRPTALYMVQGIAFAGLSDSATSE